MPQSSRPGICNSGNLVQGGFPVVLLTMVLIGSGSLKSYGQTDTIPVVIHVIHTGTPVGAPDNPSDSLIHALLGLVNDAFQKNGPHYGGADAGLHFALANRSPACTFTTGINRVDGSGVPDYLIGGITIDTNFFPNCAHEIPVKNLSRWPNADYLNLWIVHKIDSNDFTPGGFAYFPEYTSSLIDGVVLRASVVNGENKTIIHELGHYFALYHPFGDAWESCIPDVDCSMDGDLICDTENCMYAFECTETTNPCSGEAWLIADTAQGYTVLNNFMGFTNCAWMFTEGQKTRMLNALSDFRPGLLTSGALDDPDPALPADACVPTATHDFSLFYGIERVEFGDLNVYSHTSYGDYAHYVDRTCNQMVEVQAGDSILLRLNPSYGNPVQVKAFLDWDGDGTFEEPAELLVSSAFSGILEDMIQIPLSGILLCEPLRLRIVMDVPGVTEPTACHLTGHESNGVGQIEDYSVIVRPRVIQSLSGGEWDIPSVWSCNCVPGPDDVVQVNPGHTVSITAAMGLVHCRDVYLAPGAVLSVDGDLHVVGGCD